MRDDHHYFISPFLKSGMPLAQQTRDAIFLSNDLTE
jgi:hypothetical protein